MPKPFSRPDRQRLALPLLALGRDGRAGVRGRAGGRPARPGPVQARLPVPGRPARPCAGAGGGHRADRQLLQAAVDRRLPDRRALGLHLDARVHHLRRQQPDAHVPDARARPLRVPRGVGRRESVPRAWRRSSRPAWTASSATSTRATRSSGGTCTRRRSRRCTREGLRFIPQSLSEAIDEFEADEVVQSALGPELAAEFLRVKRQEWVRYHSTVEPLGDRPVPDAVLIATGAPGAARAGPARGRPSSEPEPEPGPTRPVRG